MRVLSIPVLRIPTHGCMAVISGSSPASKGNRQFPEKPDAGGAPEGRGRAAENLSPDCSARATSSSLLNLVLRARFGKQTNKNGIRPIASSELPGKVAGGRRGELSFSRSACPVDPGRLRGDGARAASLRRRSPSGITGSRAREKDWCLPPRLRKGTEAFLQLDGGASPHNRRGGRWVGSLPPGTCPACPLPGAAGKTAWMALASSPLKSQKIVSSLFCIKYT